MSGSALVDVVAAEAPAVVDSSAATGLVAADDDLGRKRDHQSHLLLGAVVAVVAGMPFAVALGVLRHPRWYPVLDMAQVELRVRDVGSAHPPLIGMAGRLDGLGVQGSHPGPLQFWCLWPIYALLGGTAWALQVATAVWNTLAITAALWLTQRRAGRAGLLAMAAALALLLRAYDFDKLTLPWNPYLAMLWWIVFLLAVWSLLCGDVAALPLAIFAGTFCVQAHIGYVGLVGAVAAVVLLTSETSFRLWWRRGWAMAACGLLALLWLSPLVEQLSAEPGNLSVLVDAFKHPEQRPLGMGAEAVRIWLAHLDIWGLARPYPLGGKALAGSVVPGLVAFAAWAAAAVAWRIRHWALLNLHAVVAAALLAGLVSVSRILGEPWFWLVLWSWGTTLVLVAATVGTAVAALSRSSWSRDRLPPVASTRTAAAAMGVAALGLVSLVFYDAAQASPSPVEVRDSRTLAHIVPDTVAALRAGDAPGGGEDGRYLVRFNEDAYDVGATGQGLVLELERQGFDVGVTSGHGAAMTTHRVIEPENTTATIHQVTGSASIERWRKRSEAVEVAYFDPRSPAEVKEAALRYLALVENLERAGLDDVVAQLTTNLVVAGMDNRLSDDMRQQLAAIIDLGHPTAVFVAPPDLR